MLAKAFGGMPVLNNQIQDLCIEVEHNITIHNIKDKEFSVDSGI